MRTGNHIVASTAAGLAISVAQAALLAHVLMDSLPYKEMYFPPARLYADLGRFLTVACPVFGLVIAFTVARKWPVWSPAIVAAAVPLFAFLAVATATFAVPTPTGYVSSAPDFSFSAALRDFVSWCSVALVLGIVCSVVAWPLLHFSRPKLGAV